jgi:MFS family permease
MFFGWYVVAGTFIAQLFVVGFFTYSVSLLVSPVRESFNASLEQMMYSLTVGTFLGMFLMPLAGAMIDRYRVRWLMTGGCLVFALCIWALAHSNNIIQYTIIFAIGMSISHSFAGSLASTTTISRWFTASRGRALGVSAIGVSVGGIVVPYLMNRWIIEIGWRSALENLALCIVLIMLPCIVVTIRGKPDDIGLNPEPNAKTHTPTPNTEVPLGFKDIVTNPAYWYIGLALGLLFGVYSAILANLTPFATSAGISESNASILISVVATGGFVGKLLFGLAADKLSLKTGLWMAKALVCISFLLLASNPSYPLMLIAMSCLGLAAGGMLPVWGAMVAKVFGLISYGKAMGLMGPLITLLVMSGFAVVGRLYELSGNYQLCLLVFAGVTVCAAALLLPLKLPQADTKSTG